MKFDKKHFFSLFRRKKTKVLTLKTMFPCCVRNAISFGFVLLAFVTLPAGCYLLESWLPQEKNNAILLLQMLILLLPLAAAGSACGIAFITADQQNDFLAQAARERNRPRPKWDDFCLYLPGIRYWFLYRHLAGELPGTSRRRLWVMLISAAFFWISWIFIGPLSPIPFCALAVSIGFWLGIARRIAGVPMQKKERLGWMLLLGCFLVSTLAGYLLFYQGKGELKVEGQLLRNAGIPTNREELEQHFYQGRTPNAEFGKLVDRNSDYNIKKGSECLESASMYYNLPESKRRKIKTYLTGELCQEDFKNIDALIESGDSLKYKMCFPNDYLTQTLMPHLNYYRTVMRYFSSRIIVALEDKNPSEAMRLFRLADKFQENVLQGDFWIGALVAISCEHIRSETIGAMLGSGLLSDDNLSEILDLNHNREKKIRRAIRYGLCTNAYLIIDTVILLNVPYLKIMSEIRYDGQWQYEEPLLRFLFRGNTTVFPTPPCLWTEAIQQRYLLYAMRHQRAVIWYFDDPTSQREFLRTDLKRELATRELYIERMLLPYYFSAEQRLQRILTMSKMTDLGLQIEQFRRKHGRLPETLDELDIPLPVDALSGEPIRFTRFARLFEEDGNGGTISRDLPGWQLSAAGGNHEKAPEEQKEYRRDFFTVITQWPVPAPPEPPKNNEGSFDFMGSAAATEEAAP